MESYIPRDFINSGRMRIDRIYLSPIAESEVQSGLIERHMLVSEVWSASNDSVDVPPKLVVSGKARQMSR